MAAMQAHMDGVLSGSLSARDALLGCYADLLQSKSAEFFSVNRSFQHIYSIKTAADGMSITARKCTMSKIMKQTVSPVPDHALKEFPDGFWSSEHAPVRAAIALCYAKTFGLGAPDFVTLCALGYLKSRLHADPWLKNTMCGSYATIANVFASRGYGAWSVWRRYLKAFHPMPAGTRVKLTDLDGDNWSTGYVVVESHKIDQYVWPWSYKLRHIEHGSETMFIAYNYGVLPEDCVLELKAWKHINAMNYKVQFHRRTARDAFIDLSSDNSSDDSSDYVPQSPDHSPPRSPERNVAPRHG